MFKILFLVDDDVDDREIFEEAIHHCNPNIKVSFARDGVEALEYLESNKVNPDAIFLDYNMPRMNGVECLVQLKANPKTKSIPTIFYTTSGSREDEMVILKLGADYYMQKTVSFNTLCYELNRLLLLLEQRTEIVKKG